MVAGVWCITLLLIENISCARDETIREHKASLVKKYLKRHGKYEGAVRLVQGNNHHEGNVEIFHSGHWGAVCDDEFDSREAAVICRQLGYGKYIKHTHSSQFGPARRKYWMDNLYCTGKEKYLSHCRFDGWGSSDCNPSEAAGVICFHPADHLNTIPTTTTQRPKIKKKIKEVHGEMKIRLNGGRVFEEGQVEVKFENSEVSGWGVVCGDGWSLLEANIVCKQLGLGYASNAVQTGFFGSNSSRTITLLSGVECLGNEHSLHQCTHFVETNVNCPGDRDNVAAVVCTQMIADLVIDHHEIMRTAYLEDRQLYFLQCAMEENCLASAAYKLQKENSYNWHLDTRRLLRFTARILNSGTADFRPAIPKHLWEFHQCHMHYHSMEVFATFDVLNSAGMRVAEGHKASFCLEDNQCLPGVKPMYACANYGDQGISVNCSDIYRHNIDCQWVDISELTPGMYTFKVSINPEFKVAEMTFINNAAVCMMYYAESFVKIYNCSISRP